jgi:hypothetical protein
MFQSRQPNAAIIKQDNSMSNLSSFYSMNYLEESMSYMERTARKLIPILIEIKKRMIPEKQVNERLS